MPSRLVSRSRPGRWIAAGALLAGLFAAPLIADGTLESLHTEVDEWRLAVEAAVDLSDIADIADISDIFGLSAMSAMADSSAIARTPFGGPLPFDLVAVEPGAPESSSGLGLDVGQDTFEVAGLVYRGAGAGAGAIADTGVAAQAFQPSGQAGGTATTAAGGPDQRLPDTLKPFNFPELASLSRPSAVGRWNAPPWWVAFSVSVSDTTERQYHPGRARILADLGFADDDATVLSMLAEQPGTSEPGAHGLADLPAILLAGLVPGAAGPGGLGSIPLGQPVSPADAPAMPEPATWVLVTTALGLYLLLLLLQRGSSAPRALGRA
jgi:hypothetical protein